MTTTTKVPWHDGTTREAPVGAPFRHSAIGILGYVRSGGWSRTPQGPVEPWGDDVQVESLLVEPAVEPPLAAVEVPLRWTWAFVELGRLPDAEVAPSVVQVQGTYSDGVWMRPTSDGQERRLAPTERVVQLLPELEL